MYTCFLDLMQAFDNDQFKEVIDPLDQKDVKKCINLPYYPQIWSNWNRTKVGEES